MSLDNVKRGLCRGVRGRSDVLGRPARGAGRRMFDYFWNTASSEYKRECRFQIQESGEAQLRAYSDSEEDRRSPTRQMAVCILNVPKEKVVTIATEVTVRVIPADNNGKVPPGRCDYDCSPVV